MTWINLAYGLLRHLWSAHECICLPRSCIRLNIRLCLSHYLAPLLSIIQGPQDPVCVVLDNSDPIERESQVIELCTQLQIERHLQSALRMVAMLDACATYTCGSAHGRARPRKHERRKIAPAGLLSLRWSYAAV